MKGIKWCGCLLIIKYSLANNCLLSDYVILVDGFFRSWEEWGTCSYTCGGGLATRARECVEPQYGGNDCVGDTTETMDCNITPCPSNMFEL